MCFLFFFQLTSHILVLPQPGKCHFSSAPGSQGAIWSFLVFTALGLQKQQCVLPFLMAFGLPCDLGGRAGQGGFISYSPLPREGSSFLVFKIVRAWVWKALCGCLLKERVPSVTQISALWYCRHSQPQKLSASGRSTVSSGAGCVGEPSHSPGLLGTSLGREGC